MSTTTSSEDKPQEIESVQRDFETSEDNEEPAPAPYSDSEEPERKRRRVVVSEKTREMRMQRYAKARLQEMDTGKTSAPVSRQRTPSVDQSVTRSEDGSRSSPATHSFPPRMGKRVRRKPQRWEGERVERPTRVTRHEEAEDDNSTASLHSIASDAEAPLVDIPFEDLRTAIQHCVTMPSRREVVDAFHTWQLRVVSKQAAQQKALHVYLKRRIRKRSARMPDVQKMEEEALRSARRIPIAQTNGPEVKEDEETALDDRMNHNAFVPHVIRLPLEAYLPRRIRKVKQYISEEELVSTLPAPPHFPGKTVETDENGQDVCMPLPTVAACAEWNARKSTSRRRVAPAKEEVIAPANGTEQMDHVTHIENE